MTGFDPRHHLNFPILNHAQPQQQNDANAMLHSSNAKQHSQQQQQHHSTTKIKQQRGSANSCNQQQQQQQNAPHLLTTTIAFPGNPLQQHVQQQQHLQQQPNQQQHTILIPTAATASQVRNVSNAVATFNNAGLINSWPCPACKVGFKSASELQAHLRYIYIYILS